MSLTKFILLSLFLISQLEIGWAQKGVQGCYSFDCHDKKWNQGRIQEFNKFKVGVGIGFIQAGKNIYGAVYGGGVFSLEPAYRITDKFAVGMRYDFVFSGVTIVDDYSTNINSYTINGQYYLSNHNFRPFVRIGGGVYRVNLLDFYRHKNSLGGVYPGIGFEVGHFSMSVEYNFISAWNYSGYSLNNNYFAFKIGGFFGGGRK